MFISGTAEKLHARPMAIAALDECCDIWFITSEETEKIEEIKTNPRVLVTFQRDHGIYVSLSGTAVVSTEKTKLEKLWKESFRVWFPKGIDDPLICMVTVKVDWGEFWDHSGIKQIKYLFQAMTAYAAGIKPMINEGEQHGTGKL